MRKRLDITLDVKRNLNKEVLAEAIPEVKPEVTPTVENKASLKVESRVKPPRKKEDVEKLWDLTELAVTQDERPQSKLYIPESFKRYAWYQDLFLCWINKKNYQQAKDNGYKNAEDGEGTPTPELHDTILMMLPRKKEVELHKESLRQNAIQTGEMEKIRQRRLGNVNFNPHSKEYQI